MADLIQNQGNDCKFFLMLPDCCLCEEEQYEEGFPVKVFIKYCGKNMLVRERPPVLIASQQWCVFSKG